MDMVYESSLIFLGPHLEQGAGKRGEAKRISSFRLLSIKPINA